MEEHEEMEEQEGNPPKERGGANMRFTTNEIMKLRHRLSEDAVNMIKEVGFEDCWIYLCFP
jgi:hypothetical protein